MKKYSKKRSFCRIFVFGLIFIFILSLSKNNYAATTTIQPGSDGNDTYLREQLPNSNFGDVDTLNIGLSAASQKMRPVLQFNLSSITNGSTITSALLKIFVNLSGSTSNLSTSVFRLTSQWFENETTWNNSTVSVAWGTAGGDFNTAENDTIGINDTLGWYTFDVKLIVRYWANNSYPNYGFLIRSDELVSSDYRSFFSSDHAAQDYRPQLIVNFTPNAAPTISSLIDDSNNTNRTTLWHNVTFTLNWQDEDSTLARIYICDTNSINSSGCSNKTYCSTSNSATNPVSCGYNVTNNGTSADNATSIYFGAVCDSASNCSSASSADNFIIQYHPTSLITAPNGGETINQTANGNFSIRFNISDNNTDYLFANIYYSGSVGARTNLIIRHLNLSLACSDSDNNTATVNNCTYGWNTTNLDGTFFIDLDVNDTLNFTLDSSDSSFNVRSLVDNTAPNITNEAITPGNITSGRTTTISANVLDPYNNTVWFSINDSSNNVANYTMTFNSNNTFNGTFTAQVNNTYYFKVYANDTRNNVNDTRPWTQFNVTTPTAISQNEIVPTTALPSSTIYISPELNAVDLLVKINATLNTPSGFVFLTDYPKTQNMSNFSAGQNKSVEWFLAVSNTKQNYTLNISYNDNYTHKWNSNNFFIDVTTTTSSGSNLSNSTFVDISAYTHVVSGSVFTSKIFVRDGSGNLVNADDLKIFMYDSLGNLVVGPVGPTLNSSTGIYLYNYTTPTTPEGQWELVANVTRSSNVFMERQYWKLVGGPFDVRDITIVDDSVPSLQITVITENTGSVTQDLTLSWNLTRTDTSAILDSGADTFAVSGKSTRTATITPSTDYIGNVKVSFIGTYSGGEKAGAFSTFNTIAESAGISAGPITGGLSGGAETARRFIEIAKLELLEYEKETIVTSNLTKVISITVTNNGNSYLHNLNIKLDNIDKRWYIVEPVVYDSLSPGEILKFNIKLTLPDLVGIDEIPFNYIINSQEDKMSIPGLLKITSRKDFILNEIEISKSKIDNYKNILLDLQNKGIDVTPAPNLLDLAINRINNAERDIKRDYKEGSILNLKEGNKYLNEVENKIKVIGIYVDKKENKIKSFKNEFIWIFVAIIVLSIIVILFNLYRKKSIIEFLKKSDGIINANNIKPENKHVDDKFMKRITDIKKRLK